MRQSVNSGLAIIALASVCPPRSLPKRCKS